MRSSTQRHKYVGGSVSRHNPSRYAKQVVYFITDGDAIKIGVASDVNDRREKLQVGNPRPLRILKTLQGSHSLEYELHHRFKKHHVRGEWFKADSTILKFIGVEEHEFSGTSKVSEDSTPVIRAHDNPFVSIQPSKVRLIESAKAMSNFYTT
jgi:Meiotically up-regulated gene 113